MLHRLYVSSVSKAGHCFLRISDGFVVLYRLLSTVGRAVSSVSTAGSISSVIPGWLRVMMYRLYQLLLIRTVIILGTQ